MTPPPGKEFARTIEPVLGEVKTVTIQVRTGDPENPWTSIADYHLERGGWTHVQLAKDRLESAVLSWSNARVREALEEARANELERAAALVEAGTCAKDYCDHRICEFARQRAEMLRAISARMKKGGMI